MANVTVPFINASDFTFDAAQAEFTGGVVQLKDNTFPSACLYSSFLSGFNGDYGTCDKTAITAGPVASTNGYADLIGAFAEIKYLGTLNSNMFGDTGAVSFDYKPNYSTTPATQQQICNTRDGPVQFGNFIEFFHEVSGLFFINANDQNGNPILAYNSSLVWSPVAGQTYNIELDFDFTAGEVKIFIDGAQFDTTIVTGIGNGRLPVAGTWIFIGRDNATSDFSIRNFLISPTVLHTSSFAAPFNVYAQCNPFGVKLVYNPFPITAIISAVSSIGTGGNKFVVMDGTSPKYWNGSAWVASNYDFVTSNTAMDMTAHLGTLTPSGSVSLVAILYSLNGITQATLTSYSFSALTFPAYNTNVVYGFIKDLTGTAIAGVQVIATLTKLTIYNGEITVEKSTKTVTSDTNGYWSMALLDTVSMETGSFVEFKFVYGTYSVKYNKAIPNEVSTNFAALVSA